MRPAPGRRQLSRDFITRHQRLRIIDALAAETAEKGYRSVTVADIVRRARIARNTFYENFRSKQDCFLATLDYALEEAMRRIVDAASEVESWQGRVRAGLGAFLGYVAEEPALARTCLVDSLSAGPESLARYEDGLQAFLPLFRLGRKVSPRGDELPATLEEAVAGGIFWVVYERIVRGEAERVEELVPDLVEFALTPYVGAEAARRLSSAD
ncbi:MAG: TetR/AcrR family transcriptional regulator [Syntrophothermus sp.]